MTPYWNCDWGNLLWRESGDLKQRSLPYISEIYILQFVKVIYRIQINFIVFHRQQTIAYALQEALLLPVSLGAGSWRCEHQRCCFKQITPRRSSVCGISWFNSSGHKEQKRKICIFCRDRIQLQRRCETLEVCCTDFLEILTYCCCRSYCLNFSHTIKQKFKHCCISNDSLITQARRKGIWLKENLGTEAVLGIYNRMTPQGFQEVPISPQWWYYRRYTYQLYTL